MIAKIHNKDKGYVLAVCDNELLGKKFSEGDKQLDLTSDFYKGEDMTEDDVADLMRNAEIVNIVGEKSVALAIREEIATKEDVMLVEGVPHVEIIMLQE